MKLNDRIAKNQEFLKDLDSLITLHEGQIKAARSIFVDGKKLIFIRCGRKWGKTTTIRYALSRFAGTMPGAGCYYVAPFSNQARELIWVGEDGFKFWYPDWFQKKWIKKINEGQMRITFWNDAFIKIDGADNLESRRGLNPHFVAFDETKDIKPKFWEGFEPNLAAHSAPCLAVGTPPDNEDNLFYLLDQEATDFDDGVSHHMPSHMNPHIDQEWLRKRKEKLINRGELDVWEREYLALYTTFGKKHIFPMFDENKHVLPYDDMLREIRSAPKQWEYYLSFDPATKTIFGVLLVAINKNDKRIYLMDELYESDFAKTTGKIMYPAAIKLCTNIQPMETRWTKIYDYAAAWFAADVANEFDEGLIPCTKDLKNKENRLSMIKDALLGGYMMLSSRCVKTKFEMKNYRVDDKGNFIKKNDHNIDNLRYILNAAHYYTVPEIPYVFTTDRRGYTLEEDRERTGPSEDELENYFSGGFYGEYSDY